ncbi:EAL domain-containing protein [Heliorestis acidaminivorans]|uniref:EAL domain-containing protein n=1 Tax=Heliorestis acidaminivorans TaxID=553427 RepID=A0A6I0ER84_9FIRM|nr:EAL domain-containing protein [Heliorestis acidaminivorans]KAB2951033.1 EAL domain-containing protein [Heliorestis acidaminivorans]
MKWFQNIKMAHKLQGLLLFFAFILALVGNTGFQTNLHITASMKAMYEERLLPMQVLFTSKHYNKEIEASTIKVLTENNKETSFSSQITKIQELLDEKEKMLEEYQKFSLDKEEKIWLTEIQKEMNLFNDALQKVSSELSGTGLSQRQIYELRNALIHTRNAENIYISMVEYSQNLAESHYQDGKKLSDLSLTITALIVIVSLISAFLLGLVLNRIVTRPLQKVLEAVEKVERGQLADVKPLPVRSADEIGKLSKGFNEMTIALQNNLRKLNEYSQAMLHQAYHDALTELPNRRRFQERLEELLEECKRNNERMAVLFIDLDQFKEINDSLGHSAGDKLLKAVSKRLASKLQSIDLFARIGGDEFTVIIAGTESESDAGIIALLIQEELNKPFQVHEHIFNISSSIGISMYPNDGEDIESLLRAADTAMYQAKRSGRNRFQFYSATMHEETRERRYIEKELQQAIEQEGLSLAYQPKSDMECRRIVGIEALVRWNHPELGWISPAKFIPIAEESGLIYPLGQWMLRSACAQNKAWQDAGFEPIRMAVNLSPYEFRQENIVEKVQQILQDTELDPQWLEIEITESSLLDHTENTMKTLEQLKSFGIHIAMDDFGTGYSSLAYLNHFPIDTLKIDKTFIDQIASNVKDAKLVDAIIGIANTMDLIVVAEGVETYEQLKLLEFFGCHQIQGYLFSRPVPADAFEELLNKYKTVLP